MDPAAGDKGEQSRFYCEYCDCEIRDSLNYLDHINGKKHNRNLGISLKKFTDCSVEEVKEMLRLKKREREDNKTLDRDPEGEIKREKRRRRKTKRNQSDNEGGDDYDDEDNEDQDEEGDDEMAKLMGFSSFSSSKR